MESFAYGRAVAVEEALAQGAVPETQFLAGGTELLNWLRLGIAKPARLIDITRLDGLANISRLANGGLRIGALARLNDVALNDIVAGEYPVLSRAILKSASAQLRNLATIVAIPCRRHAAAIFVPKTFCPATNASPARAARPCMALTTSMRFLDGARLVWRSSHQILR
jgi:xanthine dehydrogenase YagS FAD-binding subunit